MTTQTTPDGPTPLHINLNTAAVFQVLNHALILAYQHVAVGLATADHLEKADVPLPLPATEPFRRPVCLRTLQ